MIYGTAYYKNKRNPELYVSFVYIDRNNYEVVDTDYNTYAIVRSCVDYVYGILHKEIFWILTRSSTRDEAVITAAKNTIAARAPHYDLSNLKTVRQGPSCPAYLT